MDISLTIVIATHNSSDFLDNILYTLKKLTFSGYKVLVCAKTSNVRQTRKMEAVIKKYPEAEVFYRQNAVSGSPGKAEALNDLISRIDTPYGVMMDVDATFLKKNWDKFFIQQFDDKVRAGGAPKIAELYPPDFPDTYLTIFDTKVFQSLNINMLHQDVSKGQDVGWEMHGKFGRAGYRAVVLESRNTRRYKDGPFGALLGVSEYYAKEDNHIFGSHFGRGSTYVGSAKFRKGTNCFYRIPVAGRFIRMARGKKEKKQWIKICKEIVEKQV